MMNDVRVALTFDTEHPSRPGAGAGSLDEILHSLARAEAPATFFLQGRWASAYPEAARRIVREGHLIGNHSHYHAPMTLLSEEGVRTDVVKADRSIGEATGVDCRPWFRC